MSRSILGCALLLAIALSTTLSTADAQRLTHPVYRVADNGAAQPAAAATAPQPAAATQPAATPQTAVAPIADPNVKPAAANAPFDLEQRPGEHPLAPCLRVAHEAIARIDQGIADYSATFTKVERLDGELGDPQQMQIRVRHQPFSVYMKFIQPTPGQEALFVANQNEGNMVALASGWKRRLGKINLDPNGMVAMSGQRYPITRAGIRNLTESIIKIAENDSKYAECTVTHDHGARIDGRPVTMIEATHPIPRKNFRFHKAQFFFDQELRVPVAFVAYSWPTPQGGKPVLEEQYIYTNLSPNQGFTDADFSAENPAYFQ
ncbi:DUF1571 domain-containing protein [Pseudobythopirellula maris]|nr:DUF1571 domain-containing protein [Pseudobythopirellula maris]